MAANKLKLQATPNDMDALHDVVNRTRASSSTCVVPKASLERLLKDHGKVLQKLKHQDIE